MPSRPGTLALLADCCSEGGGGHKNVLNMTAYLATIPTGKLRMNEGTDASSRTTNMWITV